MGCLKSILKKILIVILIVAFFALGGWAFVKEKIKNYQYPPRAEFVESEKNYADFSLVSGDYQLYRSYNFFGYKKVNAKYLPTGQKITIFDLKNEEFISEKDFEMHIIDSKIDTLLKSLKDSVITLEDFKIIQRGKYIAKNKDIPYIVFEASVKNIPFKNVKGTIAAYTTKNKNCENPSTKLVLTIVNEKAYNPVIVKNLMTSLAFEKEIKNENE